MPFFSMFLVNYKEKKFDVTFDERIKYGNSLSIHSKKD